jgi:LPS-assembly protein
MAIGYKIVRLHARLILRFAEPIRRVIILSAKSALRSMFLRPLPLLVWLSLLAAPQLRAQQVRLPSATGAIADISSSGPQSKKGDTYIAEDDVDIHYGELRLRADHVEYNSITSIATARGHVQFDYDNQHIESDESELNISTGRGTFKNVRGTIKLDRRPNPSVLITANPLYFEAQEIERLTTDDYIVRHGWFTVCDPHRPTWQFYSIEAKITLNKRVALINSNFRIFKVPLAWLPFATTPAGEHVRQSGFLVPIVGDSNSKGFFAGDAYYWAPKPWMDATVGFEYFGLRGPSERAAFRARPYENTSIKYTYFGVQDRGIPGTPVAGEPTPIEKQGGYEQQLEVQSLWSHGWRFVTDLNQLSSLTFRLAFADNYGDAINSDIRSSVFLSNNFHGFSFNVASLNDRSFLQVNPETSVVLRSAPEARFSSVEQAPWHELPFYFSFDSFAGAVHRDDEILNTPNFVPEFDFAPKVSIPLHFGDWLGITPSAAYHGTYYGESLNASGVLTGNSISRNTGEFAIEFRPATLERFFDSPATHRRYKHTIEPYLTYRYVTGVHDFADFVRFDSNSTLTNTNELEYGFVQHLFVKTNNDQPVDFLSWSVIQKHYFDPTFGGALVPGQRNVFEALDSITAFAFASTPRNWSPIISDIKLTPGGRFDAEQILEYDTQLHKLTTIGTLLKIKPYSEFFLTVADFSLQGSPAVEPLSNQIRAILGYGSLTRQGFNASAGLSYDLQNNSLQNQFILVNYNGGCCGLAVEYRRINLVGSIRTENQFRVAFIISNLGTFGNLRRLDKIY